MALHGSADEFTEEYSPQDRLLAHNKAVRENIQAIAAMKACFDCEDYAGAFEIWIGLPQEVHEAIWLAPSKGGIFSTEERSIIQKERFGAKPKEKA